MNVPVGNLGVMLGAAVLFGLGVGFYYDCFRMFRILVRCNTVVVVIQDILFFVTAALGFFVFLFVMNEGELRLYICGLCGGGVCLYFLTLGRVTVWGLTALRDKLLAFINYRKRNEHDDEENQNNRKLRRRARFGRHRRELPQRPDGNFRPGTGN